MSRRKKTSWILTLQASNGKTPKDFYEVPAGKAEKIMSLIEPEIAKKEKKMECSSITLERFFVSKG